MSVLSVEFKDYLGPLHCFAVCFNSGSANTVFFHKVWNDGMRSLNRNCWLGTA